ncbi:PspA/IM30 family protein [Gaopeijia maritima]|uniref:PspA/IM30 family protein n=1 Tax=Gaopeijia maritima TaxID=3119007 RepID=UPI00328A2EA9
MFEDLRRAFREALDNFQQELNRDRIPGSVDRLLAGMVDEVTEAKTRLAELEAQIERTRAESAKEGEELATCLRRAALARQIDDEETARLAEEYGEKHRYRKEVLDQKADALTREAELRRSEVEEMLERVKEARTRRDALAAQAGRTEARATLDESDDLFAELDRMAEKIGDSDARAEAARAVDDLSIDLDAPVRRPDVDYDAALAELKRRMGSQG